MRSQQPWSDDPLQRWIIERSPPLTWLSIGGWAIALLVALALVLARLGGFGEVLAATGIALCVVQVLRGAARMLWLRLGGRDQPLRSYLRNRFGD